MLDKIIPGVIRALLTALILWIFQYPDVARSVLRDAEQSVKASFASTERSQS